MALLVTVKQVVKVIGVGGGGPPAATAKSLNATTNKQYVYFVPYSSPNERIFEGLHLIE